MERAEWALRKLLGSTPGPRQKEKELGKKEICGTALTVIVRHGRAGRRKKEALVFIKVEYGTVFCKNFV